MELWNHVGMCPFGPLLEAPLRGHQMSHLMFNDQLLRTCSMQRVFRVFRSPSSSHHTAEVGSAMEMGSCPSSPTGQSMTVVKPGTGGCVRCKSPRTLLFNPSEG